MSARPAKKVLWRDGKTPNLAKPNKFGQTQILKFQVTVSGWGLLEDSGKAARKLQEVDLEVAPLPIPFYILFVEVSHSHFQIIWMKECRENFHYKKSWISSKMMCTFKLVYRQSFARFKRLFPGKTLTLARATVEDLW